MRRRAGALLLRTLTSVAALKHKRERLPSLLRRACSPLVSLVSLVSVARVAACFACSCGACHRRALHQRVRKPRGGRGRARATGPATQVRHQRVAADAHRPYSGF